MAVGESTGPNKKLVVQHTFYTKGNQLPLKDFKKKYLS